MVKKPAKATASRTRKTASRTPEVKTTKQNVVLGLLRRQQGASVAEIVEATGWQEQSVHGFFAGALKKRLKIDVVSEKGEDGVRRYFVAAIKETR